MAWSRQYLALILVAGPALFYLGYFSLQRVFFERNLSHAAPLLAILCAVGAIRVANYVPHKIRAPVCIATILLAAVQPFLISRTLVMDAMRVSPEGRASVFESALKQREQVPIVAINELLVPGHAEFLAKTVEHSAFDLIVPTRDYHDRYSSEALNILSKQVGVRQVGYYPSLFPNFAANTILAYHSPNLRYLRLIAPDFQKIGPTRFVSWRQVSTILEPTAVTTTSWVKQGLHPAAAIPPQLMGIYGSFTASGGDGNTGTLRIRSIVPRNKALGIPLMTGPGQQGLSISVIDRKTGELITKMDPPPNLPNWAIWAPDLPLDRGEEIDIEASDSGKGWGQWLGIAFPVILKSAMP